MKVLYLNEMYSGEEKVLKENGISCCRIKYPFEEGDVFPYFSDDYLVRGPKMKEEEYEELKSTLSSLHCSSLVSTLEYSKIGNALEYSACFAKYAPKVASFAIDCSAHDILEILANSELQYPLFVRSNVESAAKYVGVASCILSAPTIENLQAVLLPIYQYITNATSIIMKEIVPIKKINERTIEYRAIVIDGRLICFDYDPSSGLPSPYSTDYFEQFSDCVAIATSNGLTGAYFVDFGVDINNNIFVVECKNLINGTIKNIDAFAKGLTHEV